MPVPDFMEIVTSTIKVLLFTTPWKRQDQVQNQAQSSASESIQSAVKVIWSRIKLLVESINQITRLPLLIKGHALIRRFNMVVARQPLLDWKPLVGTYLGNHAMQSISQWISKNLSNPPMAFRSRWIWMIASVALKEQGTQSQRSEPQTWRTWKWQLSLPRRRQLHLTLAGIVQVPKVLQRLKVQQLAHKEAWKNLTHKWKWVAHSYFVMNKQQKRNQAIKNE